MMAHHLRATSLLFVFVALAPTLARAEPSLLQAFLVGIDKTDNSPPLPFTLNDVNKLAQVLQESDFKVTRMTPNEADTRYHPDTSDKIMARYQEFIDGLPEKSTVIVYFSGHGGEDDNKKPHFLPKNGTSTDRTTLVDLHEVRDILNGSSAQTKVMFLDCCRSSGVKDFNVVKFRFHVPAGLHVIYGCQSGSQSYEIEKLEHGAFTYGIIDYFHGRAELQFYPDNEMTMYGLRDHLEHSVPKYGATVRQTPEYQCGAGSKDFSFGPRRFPTPHAGLLVAVDWSLIAENNVSKLTRLLSTAESLKQLGDARAERLRVVTVQFRSPKGISAEWTHQEIADGRMPQRLPESHINNSLEALAQAINDTASNDSCLAFVSCSTNVTLNGDTDEEQQAAFAKLLTPEAKDYIAKHPERLRFIQFEGKTTAVVRQLFKGEYYIDSDWENAAERVTEMIKK